MPPRLHRHRRAEGRYDVAAPQPVEPPQVWLPKEKELHYFDEKRDAPAHRLRAKAFGHHPEDQRWRRQARRQAKALRRNFSWADLRWNLRYFLGRPTDAWYRSLFEQAGDRIAGEITPNYSTLPADAVAKVHRLAPHAKIIFFLRSPVEPAWSHVSMAHRMGVGNRTTPCVTTAHAPSD